MSNHPDETRLSHQLRVLKRGIWLIALTTILVTAAAVALSLRQEDQFQATADVFIGSDTLSADLTAGTVSRDPERDLSTQARLAQLPQVAARALSDESLPPNAGEHVRSVAVTTSRDADILTFTIVADDKALAPLLATAYAKAYTEYRRDIDTRALVAARKRVELQLDKLRTAGVDRTSQLYLTLEQRRGEIRTVETLRGSKALLVRGASASAKTQPKPRRNAILGGFLGLFLGIALVLLRDALNTRVRTVEEVQQRLGLRLLARVPDLGNRRQGKDEIAMLSDPSAVQAEAFRILATNLDFANLDVGARTIMVTSAKRAEGKSTVLANLAAAYARRGQRVILADLDLRRPSVASLFGINQRPGVTDVAVGRVPLDEALVNVPLLSHGSSNGNSGTEEDSHPVGTLEVLPSGTIPPDAGELVTSPRIKNLLTALEQRADVLLLDAPPILQVGDTLALSAAVDALLVVARLSEIRRPLLDELRRVLESAPVVKLGLAVTGAAADDQYGYGYGYGYGPTAGRPLFAEKTPVSGPAGGERERA
jgi:capsular exopolysaccharide synthesis family protein